MESEGETDLSGEERVGTWSSLMNADLQMNIIHQDDVTSERRSCEVGDALYIEFEARQAKDRDDQDGPRFQNVKDWLVVVGDKDTTPALEMGLRFMHEGETSLIYSHSKYAYGMGGRSDDREHVLPPNSNVMYRVHIKRVVPADSNLIGTPSFKMELARSRKTIGNDCFQYEWSDGLGKAKALMLYKRAADAMTNLMVEIDDESVHKDASAILIDCLNNTAAVLLKAKEFGKAKDAATQVILRDPDNVKALLRAARAALYDPAGTFQESAAAIAAAEQVDPNNADLRKLKIEHRRKLKEYKEKQKVMFSKMSTAISGGKAEKANGKEEVVDVGDLRGAESETVENNHNRKYLPYLLQAAMAWFAYYLYTLMKRDSDVESH